MIEEGKQKGNIKMDNGSSKPSVDPPAQKPSETKTPIEIEVGDGISLKQDQPMREMTLNEYIEDLPIIHRAKKEFNILHEEINEAQTALKSLLELIENSDLVRNMANDDNYKHFLDQGIRITKALSLAKGVIEK